MSTDRREIVHRTMADSETPACPACGMPGISLSDTGELLCPNCGILMSGSTWAQGRNPSSPAENHRIQLFPGDTRPRGGLNSLLRIGERLDLPIKVRLQALRIQKGFIEVGTIRRVTSTTSSACIYVACKDFGIPRTLAEVGEASGANKYTIARWYRKFGFSAPKSSGHAGGGNDINSAISRTCNILAVSEKTKRRALAISGRLNDETLAVGRNPASVAAGIVYLACVLEAESVSARDVAAKAGVGRDSLFRTLKDIRKWRNAQALLS